MVKKIGLSLIFSITYTCRAGDLIYEFLFECGKPTKNFAGEENLLPRL